MFTIVQKRRNITPWPRSPTIRPKILNFRLLNRASRCSLTCDNSSLSCWCAHRVVSLFSVTKLVLKSVN